MYYKMEAIIMGVPEYIRKVKRPVNTIVAATSNPNVFIVRKRNGRKNGLPVNGPVVGHIIDEKYVDKKEDDKRKRISQKPITSKFYGRTFFTDLVSRNLLTDLKKTYHDDDAEKIYAYALMRACDNDLKDYQIDDFYEKNYISELYPNVPVSKNTICTTISNIGKDYAGMHDFMQNRINETILEKTKILIDGMLKSNTSKVNTFSAFSYKGRIKGCKDISIICAIDSQTREPLCIKVYSGNLPDFSNYKDFLNEFKIENGLIIGDKAFPFDKDDFTGKDVGTINPIKRSDTRLKNLDVFENMEILPGTDGNIQAKKVEFNGKYYYCYRDASKAAKEEKDYLRNASKNSSYDPKKHDKIRKTGGTVTFVSNMDMSVEDVYKYYELRWEIETVFKDYKHILGQTDTREQDDYSVRGSEFINFLSTIMTVRVKTEIRRHEKLNKYSYNDILRLLNNTTKVSWKGQPWIYTTMTKKENAILTELGL